MPLETRRVNSNGVQINAELLREDLETLGFYGIGVVCLLDNEHLTIKGDGAPQEANKNMWQIELQVESGPSASAMLDDARNAIDHGEVTLVPTTTHYRGHVLDDLATVSIVDINQAGAKPTVTTADVLVKVGAGKNANLNEVIASGGFTSCMCFLWPHANGIGMTHAKLKQHSSTEDRSKTSDFDANNASIGTVVKNILNPVKQCIGRSTLPRPLIIVSHGCPAKLIEDLNYRHIDVQHIDTAAAGMSNTHGFDVSARKSSDDQSIFVEVSFDSSGNETSKLPFALATLGLGGDDADIALIE